MGLEPDFELQTIAKDVEVELELNACATAGQDDQQVNTGVESTRLSDDSESSRTGGDQGGSDSKFDDTVIAPLLLIGTPPSDGGEQQTNSPTYIRSGVGEQTNSGNNESNCET